MHPSDKEKKNQQMGAIVSVGVHIVVFLLFLFIVAWRAPNPPLPEIGIELNFGLDDAGTGDEQPDPFTTPSELDTKEEAASDGMEEIPEEVVEDQTPKEETSEPITDPTEAVTETTEEVKTPVTTQESPDVVIEEPKPEEKKEEVKQPEVKKEETPKLPPVLYPNNKTGAGGKEGDANKAPNANNGDDDNSVGDKGDPKGDLDDRANYKGTKGGGGASLDITGWMWDSKPDKKDPYSERGTLILEFVIDKNGEVISVRTKESGVGAAVAQFYKDQVTKLTFSATSGSSSSSTYTGTITFVIKDN